MTKVIKSFGLFKSFTRAHAAELAYHSRVLQIKSGDFLARQGSSLTDLFFLVKGSVEVLHTHVNQSSLEVGVGFVSKVDSLAKARFTERRKDELKGKLKSSTLKRLYTIEERGILGDVELALKGDKSIFSIKCIKDSVFYVIDRLDLRINLQESQFEMINEKAMEKKEQYLNRIKEIKEVKQSKEKLKQSFRVELLDKIRRFDVPEKKERYVSARKEARIEVSNLKGRTKSVELIKPIELISKVNKKFVIKRSTIIQRATQTFRSRLFSSPRNSKK